MDKWQYGACERFRILAKRLRSIAGVHVHLPSTDGLRLIDLIGPVLGNPQIAGHIFLVASSKQH